MVRERSPNVYVKYPHKIGAIVGRFPQKPCDGPLAGDERTACLTNLKRAWIGSTGWRDTPCSDAPYNGMESRTSGKKTVSEKYRPTPFFNGVSTFKYAFPDLRDAAIEWRERRGPEDERPGELRKTGFQRGNFTRGLLPCSNPDCHGGGYQADRLVASMLALGETERQGMLLCSGRETGEEVRRGPVRCPHRIEYRVVLSPRTGDEPEPRRKQQGRRGRFRPRRRENVA